MSYVLKWQFDFSFIDIEKTNISLKCDCNLK